MLFPFVSPRERVQWRPAIDNQLMPCLGHSPFLITWVSHAFLFLRQLLLLVSRNQAEYYYLSFSKYWAYLRFLKDSYFKSVFFLGASSTFRFVFSRNSSGRGGCHSIQIPIENSSKCESTINLFYCFNPIEAKLLHDRKITYMLFYENLLLR